MEFVCSKVLAVLRGVIDDYRQQMSGDFKFQTEKIDNIFFRMIDNMEEFLLEYVQISRLIPTLFSSSSASDLKVQFNNRVNKNIEQDVNQCISHLCDWLLDRSNRTVQQLHKHVNTTSSLPGRKQETGFSLNSGVDADFTASRQQILYQLQTQSQNVSALLLSIAFSHVCSRRFFTSRRQRPVLKPMNSRRRSERRCWEPQRSKWAQWESVRSVPLSVPPFKIFSSFFRSSRCAGLVRLDRSPRC